jgi:hypothetical protein
MNSVGWSGSIAPCQSFAPAGTMKRNAALSAMNRMRAISITAVYPLAPALRYAPA